MKRLKKYSPGRSIDGRVSPPLRITAYRLAKEIAIPQTRLSEILKGRRRITADTALRLSKYFGNSAKFWLGLQDDYDIEEEQHTKQKTFESIVPLKINAA